MNTKPYSTLTSAQVKRCAIACSTTSVYASAAKEVILNSSAGKLITSKLS